MNASIQKGRTQGQGKALPKKTLLYRILEALTIALFVVTVLAALTACSSRLVDTQLTEGVDAHGS